MHKRILRRSKGVFIIRCVLYCLNALMCLKRLKITKERIAYNL